MKKCTVLANTMLAYAYFAYVCVIFVASVVCCFLDMLAGITCLLASVLTVIIACFITERWCLTITFMQDGIIYKPLFRQAIYKKYANYPRIQYAFYMHGNIIAAYKVHFFIFTNRRLSNEELSHINNVAPNDDLIKIRYTKKSYERLIAALPQSVASDIERIYVTHIK